MRNYTLFEILLSHRGQNPACFKDNGPLFRKLSLYDSALVHYIWNIFHYIWNIFHYIWNIFHYIWNKLHHIFISLYMEYISLYME